MPNTFRYKRRVQFAETDMAGVMHFANYFRLIEETEHAFYRSMGLSIMMFDQGAEIGWPRASATCEYFAPVRFEQEIELHLRVADVGQKSLTYDVDFLRDGQRIARGRITKVCCRVADGSFESIPIPDRIRRRLRDAMHGAAPAPQDAEAADREPPD